MPRLDVASLLRALDRAEEPTDSWLVGVAVATRRLRGGRHGSAVFRFAVEGDYEGCRSWSVPTGEEFGLDLGAYADRLDRAQIEFYFRPQAIAGLARKALLARVDVEDLLQRDLLRTGAEDITFMCASDGAQGVCIHVPTAAGVLPARQRSLLEGTAAQLDAGLRVRGAMDRAGPEAVVSEDAALLSPEGRVLGVGERLAKHTPLARLREILEARERVKRAGRAGDLEAQVGWVGVVNGEWSFVDIEDRAGRRSVVVARTPAAFRAERRLSQRERQVVEHVARGGSSKEIGLTIGMSEANVAKILARALAKLGLRSRAELVRARGLFD